MKEVSYFRKFPAGISCQKISCNQRSNGRVLFHALWPPQYWKSGKQHTKYFSLQVLNVTLTACRNFWCYMMLSLEDWSDPSQRKLIATSRDLSPKNKRHIIRIAIHILVNCWQRRLVRSSVVHIVSKGLSKYQCYKSKRFWNAVVTISKGFWHELWRFAKTEKGFKGILKQFTMIFEHKRRYLDTNMKLSLKIKINFERF